MSPKKVLFICQEISPYLPDTLLSTTCRNLPQATQEGGFEIRTFMPKYGCINERRNQLHEVIRLSGMNLIINDNDHPLIIKVASIQAARMQVYFIDNEDFFHRKYITKDAEGKDFDDNDDRSVFFIRGIIETVRKLRWVPDLIHCHGWMSAVAPLYLKKAFCDDPFFKDSKIVYSVYNDGFSNTFADNFAEKVIIEGINPEDVADVKDVADYKSLMKLAFRYSDGIIQAEETIDPDVRFLAENAGKPFIVGSPDNNFSNYLDFYNSL